MARAAAKKPTKKGKYTRTINRLNELTTSPDRGHEAL